MLDRPDLEVYRLALRNLQEAPFFVCCLIDQATRVAACRRGMSFYDVEKAVNLYVGQFTKRCRSYVMRGTLKTPKWWDKEPTSPMLWPLRIAALESFIAACEEAGKKEHGHVS